ncbi:MAG: T9SS type A sorting domain-containing protein [Brumimicrobium sp.]|nr:T9SS type A sorting domain-containing protein [Brumimicrobium sp.]
MNKIYITLITLFIFQVGYTQDYAPAAGLPGSTAIKYDSSVFVAWATGIDLSRGYINIENPSASYNGFNYASYGEPEDALGPASGNSTDGVVSLGDSGVAILTFKHPIINGDGWDFAIFENSVTDDFLELAFVEVSSDGVHFVRFPNHSKTQTTTPIGSFGSIEATDIHNLAGKYRVGFGTPFDLEDLKDSVLIDIQNITHIKIIDVVGTLGNKGGVDSYGNKINDPFPTAFHSGGFDLAGVGVIHHNPNVTSLENLSYHFIRIYPNPTTSYITIEVQNEMEITLKDILGATVLSQTIHAGSNKLSLESFGSGIYFLRTQGETIKLIKE